MCGIHGRILGWLRVFGAVACLAASGCHVTHHGHHGGGDLSRLPPVFDAMPRELQKVALHDYIIEPPDILRIETVHAVPRAPYRLRTLDVISVQVVGSLPDAPISGAYPVEPGGIVNLGVPYGGVFVAGMTVAEAQQAVEQHLRQFLREPRATVALVEMAASQQLFGEFLVGPDGTVTLGSYGSVRVVGLTVAEAKCAIEQYLSYFLENPVISLEVFAFNSKVYYLVLQGAGFGDGVYRLPVTGNETVLDAISQIQGLDQVSSKRIWVARPSRDPGNVQVLPVDYIAITERAETVTNYQLLPGDRVFVAEDKLIKFDNSLAKLLAPVERAMGFSLLGVGTVTRFSGKVLRGGGNQQSAF